MGKFYNDNLINIGLKKRYLKIYQHLTLLYLSSPPPFLCSQIITSFLNSMISNRVVILAKLWNPYTLILVLVFFWLNSEIIEITFVRLFLFCRWKAISRNFYFIVVFLINILNYRPVLIRILVNLFEMYSSKLFIDI